MDVDISITSADWSTSPDIAATIERAARMAVSVGAPAAEADAELSILLASDAFVRGLNHRYRGRDSATNVLSFPQKSPGRNGARGLLGDIALAYETVAREARAAGKPLEHHAAHLVVHGVLHLFGYDHDDDTKAAQMEERERAILFALGIPDPYAHDEAPTEPAKVSPAP